MKVIGITLETMDFCIEDTCKHYYNDLCMYPTGHKKYHKGLIFENPRKCPMYQKGKNDAYYYQDRLEISRKAKDWNKKMGS